MSLDILGVIKPSSSLVMETDMGDIVREVAELKWKPLF